MLLFCVLYSDERSTLFPILFQILCFVRCYILCSITCALCFTRLKVKVYIYCYFLTVLVVLFTLGSYHRIKTWHPNPMLPLSLLLLKYLAFAGSLASCGPGSGPCISFFNRAHRETQFISTVPRDLVMYVWSYVMLRIPECWYLYFIC